MRSMLPTLHTPAAGVCRDAQMDDVAEILLTAVIDRSRRHQFSRWQSSDAWLG